MALKKTHPRITFDSTATSVSPKQDLKPDLEMTGTHTLLLNLTMVVLVFILLLLE